MRPQGYSAHRQLITCIAFYRLFLNHNFASLSINKTKKVLFYEFVFCFVFGYGTSWFFSIYFTSNARAEQTLFIQHPVSPLSLGFPLRYNKHREASLPIHIFPAALFEFLATPARAGIIPAYRGLDIGRENQTNRSDR